ncbi:hypothetical protein [Phreatobacter sp. AB_2022a]|uniref:hypothetical protein n=1 Tax=Phreatobacter sp. AB_2022a TaxID=3003134 RepID=UPI0022871A6B|nr:hypothetical protein [Phreatobacter sp. AB_2022a]MCZ0735111.1 hypothetical protein [Phreatobacter sp. AB_2022a]
MARSLVVPRIAVLVTPLALAACVGTDGPMAGSPPPRGAIAFEAIDGAPQAVNQRLAGRLAGEAEARQIQVVADRSGARYRVRGYMATARAGNGATVSYVWDVFDPERRRSTRISGEERIEAHGRDPWAGVDDAAAGRIASRSMEQIATWLATPQGAPQTAAAVATTAAEPAPATPPAAPAAISRPVVAASTTGAGSSQVMSFASPQAAPAGAPPQSTDGTGGPLIPAEPPR